MKYEYEIMPHRHHERGYVVAIYLFDNDSNPCDTLYTMLNKGYNSFDNIQLLTSMLKKYLSNTRNNNISMYLDIEYTRKFLAIINNVKLTVNGISTEELLKEEISLIELGM